MNIEDICTVAQAYWSRHAAPVRPGEDPLVAGLVREHSLHCPSCAAAAESARLVRSGLRAAGVVRRGRGGWKDRLTARLSHALAEARATDRAGSQTLAN